MKTAFKFIGTLCDIRKTVLNVYFTNPDKLLWKATKCGRFNEVVIDVVVALSHIQL